MPFLVVKSRTIKLSIFIILIACLLSVSIDGVNAAQVYFGYPAKKVPVYCVDTEEQKVAISFDAAWGADKTEKIMDILKEYKVNATFFLVSFWAEEHSDLVKKIDESGFEIGSHSNSHPDFVKLSETQMKQELEGSIATIEGITNKKVEVFRFPFGSYNNTAMKVCEEMNLIPIQWDVDTLDWKGISASEICKRVVSKVKNGSIILCHNNSDHIVDALPIMLDRLQKKGYEVTSVGNLIYKSNYTILRDGTQTKVA